MPGAPSEGVAGKLARLGLHTPADCKLHLPLRYEDETCVTPIDALDPGVSAQIEACVVRAHVLTGRRRILEVVVGDDSGTLSLRFLHFWPSHQRTLVPGARVRAQGEMRLGLQGPEMLHPRWRCVEAGDSLPQRLTPVYPAAGGVTQPMLRAAVRRAMQAEPWADTIPPQVLAAVGLGDLPPLEESLRRIHAPLPGDDVDALNDRRTPECRRIAFEELVAQQLSLQQARARRATFQGVPLAEPESGSLAGRLLAELPFRLTGAQQRVRAEIDADLTRSQPMNRLLQGDVGSGKTVIAALAALRAIGAGHQVALMAPTEILARQHFERLSPWFGALQVPVGWIAGSLPQRERRRMRQAVADGAVPLVIGTHALIEERAIFDRLALVMVDEQHRFGVAQRLALRTRADGRVPHLLMMSATPIPRTLAMTFYADLDVSVIDELPPGRTPVRTLLVSDARRAEVVVRIHAACASGRQVYWVCPLVEESEALALQHAQGTQAQLQADLPDLVVGLVHGRLAQEEKAAVMQGFAAGTVHVLVATTVIEVGVDVPNASLMVIEHAERFGLSQLHQLRGRVGRGTHESVCVLLFHPPVGQTAKARLMTMRETTDGFEIARRDLALRGPGEFLGARQSGTRVLRFADIERDVLLVDAARDAALAMLTHHPQAVCPHLERWVGQKAGFLEA